MASKTVDVFREIGIELEPREGLSPVYRSAGVAISVVEVAVDLCDVEPGEESLYTPQEGFYTSGHDKCHVPVVAASLTSMLVGKLNCVNKRARATDFFDMWIGVEKCPERLDEMRQIVRRLAAGEGGSVPFVTFRTPNVLANLERVEETWEAELAGLTRRIPPYACVRQRLRDWFIECWA